MRSLKIALFLLFTCFVIHITYITIDGLSDRDKTADIAVILGTKVNEDGTLSERLTKRLDCGIKLFHENRVQSIIVSGGLGKEGFFEGDKMKEYLVSKAIPQSAIIVDNNGNNTLLSVENTITHMDSSNLKTVIAVSQYYHLTRTKMLFRKLGVREVSSISPRYFCLRDVYAISREFVAFYVGLI